MLRVVVATRSARSKDANQDRIAAGGWVLGTGCAEPVEVDLPDGSFVAVVDGMGGAAAGEVASGLAADALASAATAGTGLIEAVHRANQVVYNAMARMPALAGMGATAAAVEVGEDDTVIVNVGDARVYVEIDGELIRTSTDDRSPTRPGVLTASLGGMTSFEAVSPHVIRERTGERRFLLASDGLTDPLDDDEIRRAIDGMPDEDAVAALLKLVEERGVPDDVSIALVRRIERRDERAERTRLSHDTARQEAKAHEALLHEPIHVTDMRTGDLRMFRSRLRKDLDHAIQDYTVAYVAEMQGFGHQTKVTATSNRVIRAATALHAEEGDKAVRKAIAVNRSFAQGPFVGTELGAQEAFMRHLEQMLR